MANYFKLHVINPPGSLDWRSPRGLLLKTVWHHLIQDMAPIGHYNIEIGCDEPNAFGVTRVLTGMSRLNPNLSTLKVAREKVGIGSFYYDFPGRLDEGSDALAKLEKARNKGRLRTITVPLSVERARLLMDELHLWIKNGSFRHYGGGHRISKGEGSCCAELGAHFFNLAMGSKVLPEEWVRSVYAPEHLVGGHRTGRKVSMFQIILEGLAWADGPETGILYSVPDMELTTRWLESRFPGQHDVTVTEEMMSASGKAPSERIVFEAGYPEESSASIATQWKQISIKV